MIWITITPWQGNMLNQFFTKQTSKIKIPVKMKFDSWELFI